jgi:DDE superfamily endonuclease
LARRKKNARRRGAWIVFEDESGFSLLPSVRGTWAPRGKTPVLIHHFSWKRLSMVGGLAYAPDGTDAKLMFSMRAGSYNDDAIIEFLIELHDHLDGAKATVIWDGLMSHRSKKMVAFVKSQRRWLVVERLPPYGHDLNPIEQVWGNLKGNELANLCPDTIGEAAVHANAGLSRIDGDASLCFAFLRHTGLSL